jgi:hypothetical protein
LRACYAVNDHFAWSPDVSGRGGAAGDPCEFINVCAAGLLCLTPDATPGCDALGCCTPICELSAPPCPAGQACVPWYADNEAPPGLADVGICTAAA